MSSGAPRPSSGAILRKASRGVGWIIGWRAVTRMLGFVNTLILARLLLPADFGLVALGLGFRASLQALSDLGISQALIRHPERSRELYDTGFTIGLIRACFTGLCLIAAAWPVARFFGDPRLVQVMAVLAFCEFLGGLSNIGVVDYQRTLDFRSEFILLALPRFISFGVTLAVGFLYRSYWALLVGILVGRCLRLIQSYAMHPYRPRFSFAQWRYLAGFSFWTWAIGIAQVARDRTAAILLAAVAGEAEVGTFSVGMEIATLPITEFLDPIAQACFAVFAAARHTGENEAAPFLRVMALSLLVSLPAAIGISALAEPVERLLLGPRWLGAIPVIQVLGVLSFSAVVWLLSEMMLTARAELSKMFRLSVIFAVVRVGVLAFAVPRYGIMGAVWAFGLAAMIEHFVWMAVAFRSLGIPIAMLFARAWRSAVATLGMGAGLFWAGLGWTTFPSSYSHLLGSLGLAVIGGAALYAALLLSLWLVCGRPDGPEADGLLVAKDTLARFFPAVARRMGVA